jgi:hypothetical protein
LQEADVLLPLLFNFALGRALRRVQANQEGWKLNDRHQLSVYVDDVKTLEEADILQLVSGQEMV